MSRPWMKFYPADWQADQALGLCTLAARGLWIEMMAIMHKADPYGHLLVNGRAPTDVQLAALARCPPDQIPGLLDELENAGVFSKTRNRTIYSRRMAKDERRQRTAEQNGNKGGGNPSIRRGTVPKHARVRPFRRSDNPAKTLRVFERGNGLCCWCECELVFESAVPVPNLFHVGHVVLVSDGGTNDEDNLVSECATCNRARVRNDWIISSDTNPDRNPHRNPDSKAQKLDSRKKERKKPPPPPLPGGGNGITDPPDEQAVEGGAETGELIEFEFEAFYRAYPRRKDRGHAEKAYAKARRLASGETLLEGARRYAIEQASVEEKFIALPASWLNGKRWLDEPDKRRLRRNDTAWGGGIV